MTHDVAIHRLANLRRDLIELAVDLPESIALLVTSAARKLGKAEEAVRAQKT